MYKLPKVIIDDILIDIGGMIHRELNCFVVNEINNIFGNDIRKSTFIIVDNFTRDRVFGIVKSCRSIPFKHQKTLNPDTLKKLYKFCEDPNDMDDDRSFEYRNYWCALCGNVSNFTRVEIPSKNFKISKCKCP